jgi:uncharacterized protein (TIGR03000 family)
MFRKTFAVVGTLLVAAALGFMTPGPAPGAEPQRGFRGAMASPRPSAMRFGPAAARPAGGFRYGGYRVGFAGGYPYRPYYWGGYNGWNRAAYGGAVYYPYRGGYASYYPYNYNYYLYNSYYPYDYSYLWSGSPADPAAAGYDPPGAAVLQAQLEGRRARVTVAVPDGARVWFDGTPTTSTGPVREYVTPPLEPGGRSTCWVRACWNENGREMNQLQPVEVTAGGQFSVSFPAPSRNGN